MTKPQRTFEDKPAVREKLPLLVGLFGPSGSGKTYSALRLAAGIQRVNGGQIFVADTEGKRALHYADRFSFQHVDFRPPFGPLDYLAAIEHCAARGASVVVIDSTSHEHEGEGGVLEMHEAELTKLAGNDYGKREAMKMLAWAKPKQERQRLINRMLQLPVSFILCFRAKEKVKPYSKQEREQAKAAGERLDGPKQLGWMPIGEQRFVFEMTLSALLLPGASGVPKWDPIEESSRAMVKLPEQFKAMYAKSQPLSEDLGEAMARWAAGSTPRATTEDDALIARFDACTSAAELELLEKERAAIWKTAPALNRKLLKAASDAAIERLKRAAEQPDREPGAEG